MYKFSFKDAKKADLLLDRLRGDITLDKEEFLADKSDRLRNENENISKILIHELYIKFIDNKYSLSDKGFFIISNLEKYGFVSAYKKNIYEKVIIKLTFLFTLIAILLQAYQICIERDKINKENTKKTKAIQIDSIPNKTNPDRLYDTALKKK